MAAKRISNHGILAALPALSPLKELSPQTVKSNLGEKTPAGVFSLQLSRILPHKGAVSPPPAWIKRFEPTVIQNPMTVRRSFIIVIEKYLGKESNSKRCAPIFRSCCLKDRLT
ncbi:hypothetical protein AVEN_161538-1 [Araneus ventricosus]|uniref:Uncharacterized protein n=1 Tax=Araneus ventricosus TaxID=182803 RepID=A0A4Y2S1P3_ARAVE|nr:hypothetical protein AVEN_161538-1 [Araneus ventricosus]